MPPSLTPAGTLHAVGDDLRHGRRTSVDVVQECLSRIEQREADVRAWVLVDREAALRRARELDDERRADRYRGPLHGIPIGIKDIIDVAGWPTVAGYPPWTGNVAGRDADVVARLREHGAIILGKTVTTQFAGFDPPVTRNPWNVGHTPGGSSSGSAAAVAAGMCLAAIGTQTGGSITRPASFCGDAACKPTFGRVSLAGIVPLSPKMDHVGPIAPTVRDAAILLEALLTPADAGTPTLVNALVAALDRARPAPPRIGRLRGFYETLAEPAMNEAVGKSIEVLKRAGALVVDVDPPPSFETVLADHKRLISAGAADVHRERYRKAPDSFLPRIREQIEFGLASSELSLDELYELQAVARKEICCVLDGLDALLCPASRGAAPDTSTTGDPSFNAPWSFTGLPVVSFPVGRTAAGLPLCVQMIGRPFEEASLFRTSEWIERRVAAA